MYCSLLNYNLFYTSRANVFLFSGAGGIPEFWTRFAKRLQHANFNVHVVTYPGRFNRIDENRFSSAIELVDESNEVAFKIFIVYIRTIYLKQI